MTAETDLLVLGLAQDGCRVEANFLLFGTLEHLVVTFYVDQVRVHSCYKSCLDHCPVLRIQIYIPDIATSPGTNKT